MTVPIKRLQQSLKELKLDGLLIPKIDSHRCEFTLERDNYLQFVTGFTGSAGFAVVLLDSAALFVDGRYTLQAKKEVDGACFSLLDYRYEAICQWIQDHMKPQQTLGYDPLLFSEREVDIFKSCCQATEVHLTAIDHNPIAHLWLNRPQEKLFLLDVHPVKYSGEKAEDKIRKVCDIMKRSKAQGLFLNTPESIAWLLNIRCPNRPYTPVAPCYFYLSTNQQGFLFIKHGQAPESIRDHFGKLVAIRPYEEAFEYLHGIEPGTVIMMDPTEVPIKAITVVQERQGHVLGKANPCEMLKACKNAVEIQGARDAHVRDGTAVVNLLAWLYQKRLPQGITEVEIAQKLFDLRAEQSLFRGVSFETIAGSGPNGSIIHYRATQATNRKLKTDELLLLDSGAQYLDGTTDITRTLSLNSQPTAEQKDRFTRVLKGHIALAKAIFPPGTTGSQLDILARQFLWDIGCDYAHGTGHGVGSYLGVHEGPQSISSRPNSIPLKPGMILSNEPGYYKTNEYGIRIESLVVVKPIDNPLYELEMYGFETLSAVPIDLSLIDARMLTEAEREWINCYHHWVREILMAHVLEETRPWLQTSTREI